MTPRRLSEDAKRSQFRLKSVIVKPSRKPVRTEANEKVNQATKTIKSVVIEGQSDPGNRCIRVKIDGRDIDYFDGFVARDVLVPELLPRSATQSHLISEIESLSIANLRDKVKLDVYLMAKFSVIFKTVSVSKEVSITETVFGREHGSCGLTQLMKCFENFKPKRFREDGIHCISLLHAEHIFTSNGVPGFFFDGDNSGECIRSLDIGTGCNPIKRMAPPFLHYFIQAARFPNAPSRFRLVAPLGDVELNIRAYDRAVTTERGASKIMLPQEGLVIDLPKSDQQTIRIRRD